MNKKLIITTVLAGTLAFGTAFAGQPGQADQPGQSDQAKQAGPAYQCGCHKPGFFQKIGESFKKGFQAGKMAGTKAFDCVQNKVMDSGTAIKKAVTGEKSKTFVKGHYKSDGTHVKGHWRQLNSNGKKS